jgi:succinate dehydrogenase / fumarate reductase, membrane anchor subunit
MAIEADRPSQPIQRRDSLGTGRPRSGGRERPGRGAEFWWWVFMRVSGVILLFLAVGHVLIMHAVGDGVDRVNFGFVAVRWANPFWQTWDWLMLSLALVHGINGLRVISLDYLRRPGIRVGVNGLFAVVGIVLFALGTVVVFTFNACQWPDVTAALRRTLGC